MIESESVPRAYKIPVQPCRNCKAPVIFAQSLAPEDQEYQVGSRRALTLDAQPMRPGNIGSRKDFVIAAWNVPPDGATFVVRWSDDPADADEPIYRRHNCVRLRGGSNR